MAEWMDRLSLFDISEGLQRVGGDEEFYKMLVAGFYSEYCGGAEKLRSELEAGDRDSARILVHSVKGNSGNLGAGILQSAAAELEKAIKLGDDEEISSRIPSFESELARVLEDIAQSGLLEAEEEEEKEEGTLSVLPGRLERFSAFASSRKARPAGELLNEICSFSWSDEIDKSLADIRELAKKYRLAEAAQAADGLRDSLERRERDV